jgi:GT2 family glycosyltransferase
VPAGDPGLSDVSDARLSVSVLICSYNVREHVDRCLASLRDHHGGVDLEVILVDNASRDGTVAMVLERYPWVRVVANQANVGFAPANNQALGQATSDYVLYLNPDTEVGPGTLRRCAGALEADPSLGMVGCRLLYPDGRIQYECARRAYRLGDLLIEFLYLHRIFPHHPLFGRQLLGDWDHQESRDVEGISGAFMMMPRALVEELGGMATEVFAYHEDMDLALRVRQAGYRIRYLADVWTVHHTSQSSLGRWTDPGWGLLELETNTRLIRQIQGRGAAWLARGLYAARSLVRTALAVVGQLLPGRIRRSYPLVFSPSRHLLQLAWSISPGRVRHRLPRATPVAHAPPPEVHPARGAVP